MGLDRKKNTRNEGRSLSSFLNNIQTIICAMNTETFCHPEYRTATVIPLLEIFLSVFHFGHYHCVDLDSSCKDHELSLGRRGQDFVAVVVVGEVVVDVDIVG